MKPHKTCRTCGRVIEWRKKWESCWDEVRYCSTLCRQSKPNAVDRKLEKTILALLDQRANTSTICPGEVARAEFPQDEWREHMEQTRQAARRLVSKGLIEILQKGRVVDPSTAKGPIRLRKKPGS